jgi:hypothetical protein
MPEFPLGLSLMETEEGFILARRQEDETIQTISISKEELNGLKTQIAFWQGRILQHKQGLSGSAHPIISHPARITQVGLAALDEKLLITFEADSGADMTFAVPFDSAEQFCELYRKIMKTREKDAASLKS